MHAIIKFMSLGFAVALATACGAPPVVQSSEILVVPAQKTQNVRFVYNDVDLVKDDKQSRGTGNVALDSNGFGSFGPNVVAVSTESLAKYGLAVADSSVLKNRETLAFNPSISKDIFLLVITPVRANISQSGRAIWANHRFNCQLIHPSTGKVSWRAFIDTQTFRPQFDSAPMRTELDEKYARQFLDLLAQRLRKDGFI